MTSDQLAEALSDAVTSHLSEGLKMVYLDDVRTIKATAEFMNCLPDVRRDVALIKQISGVNNGPAGAVTMYANDTDAWAFWLVIDIRSEGSKLTKMRAVVVLAEKTLEQVGRNMAIQVLDFLRDGIREKQNLQVLEDFQAGCE